MYKAEMDAQKASGAPMEFEITLAGKKHWYSITAMTAHYFPYAGFSYEEIMRRLQTKNIFYFVALAQGHTVGFVDFEVKAASAQILGVAVLEPFRGKGIGTALLERAILEIESISSTRAPPLERIDLLVSETNPAALKLYAKLGFKRFGKLKRQLWGQDILVYSKYLKEKNG